MLTTGTHKQVLFDPGNLFLREAMHQITFDQIIVRVRTDVHGLQPPGLERAM
jgi:hypothetical protein